MRIVVFGGTVFVGRAFVEAALKSGHDITLFHRGQSGGEVFPNAKRVLGDRDGDLDRLGNGSWDAVVDFCGYVPRVVNLSAKLLEPRVGRYVFISTRAVYENADTPGLDENAPLKGMPDPENEMVDARTYAPLKVLCEQKITEIYKARATIVRAGLLEGPNDQTNRLTHWVRRFTEGGEVLTPDKLDQPLQILDVRDLGDFLVHCLENDIGGTFNATGYEQTFGQMIEACIGGQDINTERHTPYTQDIQHNTQDISSAEPFYASERELAATGVSLWTDLPLSLPSSQGSGSMQLDCSHAYANGLRPRPLKATVDGIREWMLFSPTVVSRFGIDLQREQQAIAAIRAARTR